MESNNKKFLTVFAVFDDNTQYKLNMLKQIISYNNIVGNMITDIPFHISLGSYPLDMKEELINKIKWRIEKGVYNTYLRAWIYIIAWEIIFNLRENKP